jgi:alditol oxidase
VGGVALGNWAGSFAFGARGVCRPRSLGELREVVRRSPRVRVLGTGHSFSRIADTSGDLVCVTELPQEAVVDRERATVTVSAGMRYGELAGRLRREGLALHNLGSLAHISVAGACQTSTHGSGNGNGSLATAVTAVEMVTADGDVVTVSREADGEEFDGAVVALGALGVVTRLTLRVEPGYEVRQHVYEDLPWDALSEHFAEVFASAYSVSVFTDWRSPAVNQVWLKQRTDRDGGRAPGPRWLGATLAQVPRHPLAGMSPENCTAQLGVAGPWDERLPHFRLDYTPSSGEELQSEYFVAREDGPAALAAIAEVRQVVAPVLQACEIRTVAADGLWLSPAYRRDSVAFHFTWVKDAAAVAPVLTALERQLTPFAVRAHWAKLFRLDPQAVRAGYERAADFTALARRYDPEGRFRNAFLDTYLPGG